jgi:cystathionine beta-lyase/cystathionine gamma-synthase
MAVAGDVGQMTDLWIRPILWATAPASPRVSTSSFLRMRDTCVPIVRVLTLSCWAMRLFAQPSAMSVRTSRSRRVRPKVDSVSYPGHPSHPDHALAAELFDGFGGMLSLRPAGGAAAAEALLKALRIPAVAPSLGGVESLITRPVATSHAGMPAGERERIGVTDDLIRLSCGIEAADDLIADFDQALKAV